MLSFLHGPLLNIEKAMTIMRPIQHPLQLLLSYGNEVENWGLEVKKKVTPSHGPALTNRYSSTYT